MAAAQIINSHTFFFFLLNSFSMASHSSSSQPIKGVYYPSWSNIDPSSIKAKLYTHVYYACLNPNPTTFQFDIDHTLATLLLNFTSTLHAKKSSLKTLLSIGGYSAGTATFTRLASSSASRAAFIQSSIQVARKYGFDGVDFDWEFPENAKAMDNFGILLKEWRAEVQTEAKATGQQPLLLTAVVYYAPDFPWGAHQSYPAASISKNLDWINVMNYDYHGSWDTSSTGSPAALFDPNSNMSTSYGLKSWIQAGVPVSKLVMGMPLFGWTWKLWDGEVHDIGAAAIGVGPGSKGMLPYAEVVKFNSDNNAKVVYDKATKSVYSVAGDIWIGYDDVKTVGYKIKYARSLGLRGYFFWAMDGDYEWTLSKIAKKLISK